MKREGVYPTLPEVPALAKRSFTTKEWKTNGIILQDGEQGYEKDTNTLKIGNGKDLWKKLPSISGQIGVEIIETGILLSTTYNKDAETGILICKEYVK